MGAWDADDLIDKDSNLFGLNVLGEKWVGTVESARWFTDVKVDDGETIMLELVVDNGNPNPDFNPLKISYKNGKKFETTDGGRTITPLKEGTKVHPNSAFGILLSETLKIKGVVEAMQENGAKSPLEAKAWEGLTFTWGVKTTDYKGEIGKMDRWVPIALGADESVVSGGGSTSNSEPRGKEEIVEELTVIAGNSSDADDYLAKAMQVDGFTDHEDLVSGYKEFWAEVNK